ncbi:MAG: NAD-dependent epimerase/dehydratase family protein [Candidatus Daviesbacteria bacterium]|nr:NAD-dependent epimerase/dehydratase family protein [Candidatus Daviesbacteria bacterium]
MKVLVTGAAGFIGSHLSDYLIKKGCTVYGIDNCLTGDKLNLHPKVKFTKIDIRDKVRLDHLFKKTGKLDYVFHLAAIARTGWTVTDPTLANDINITGTLNVLLAAREAMPKKVIFASSNIVYAKNTPYWVTKKTGELYMRVFDKLYHLPTVSLRLSNAYGSLRQSEKGPDINCIASMRKSKQENGFVWVSGDGKQSRDFTHVLDIAEAFLKAAKSDVHGAEIDICTGINTTINQIAKQFKCPIKYVDERKGDIKHIYQNPQMAGKLLGFKAKRKLEDHIRVYLK